MQIVHTINLSHREDRLLSIARQAKEQGFALKIWEGISRGIPRDNINAMFRKIVSYAKEQHLEYVLIAEDDCVFHSSLSFAYFIKNMPETFDLYLGMIYTGDTENGRLISEYNGNTLMCVHETFYDTFLSMPKNVHVDIWLGKFVKKYNYYVCEPYICKQLNGYSDNRKATFNYDYFLQGKTFL